MKIQFFKSEIRISKFVFSALRADPSTTQNLISPVKNCPLPRGYGTLGIFEPYHCRFGIERNDRGRHFAAAVPHARIELGRLNRPITDPVNMGYPAFTAQQVGLRTDDQSITVAVEAKHIIRFGRRTVNAASLADCE